MKGFSSRVGIGVRTRVSGRIGVSTRASGSVGLVAVLGYGSVGVRIAVSTRVSARVSVRGGRVSARVLRVQNK